MSVVQSRMPDQGEQRPAIPEDQVTSSTSTDPHRMRITSGGHIRSYVSYALTYLQENPHRPLILHTLPPPASSSSSTSQTNPQSAPSSSKSSSTLHSCTTTTSRLVSIVEIIKRDYMTSKTPGKGKHRAEGLWQYTESGLLPNTQAENEGAADLSRVLSGKTKPKMVHRPYLEITLSTRPLGLEKTRNVTCQYVITRRSRRPRGARGSGSIGEEGGEEGKEKSNSEQEMEKQSSGTSKKAVEVPAVGKTHSQKSAKRKGGETGLLDSGNADGRQNIKKAKKTQKIIAKVGIPKGDQNE